MLAPPSRIQLAGQAPPKPDGRYVVYWMLAQRRTRYNFGLQHAIARAREFNVPLLVIEALSCSYRWASDRMHAFAIQGMLDQQAAFEDGGIEYYPYVEPEENAGQGLHTALGKEACLYVTDHWPCFHMPKWVRMVAAELDVRMEVVDSCGILPVQSIPKAFARAHDFRRQMHRDVYGALQDFPVAQPLEEELPPHFKKLPAGFAKRYPRTKLDPSSVQELIASLPIDHEVHPVEAAVGGQQEALTRLDAFIDDRLPNYLERNKPEVKAASGLSPWLHWGHVSSHEIFKRVADCEGWDPSTIEGQKATGKREGWWGMSPAAEGFLDELITWREVCFNTCEQRPKDYGKYESLPDFAKKTLDEHRGDPRPQTYSLDEFERAATHDTLWNAAQNQLRRDGIIHNYLRMLWGKKILHWSKSPEEAHSIMVELNNKYGLDGRDPNSWGGIMWTLGRYDRAWGPEREIFGKVRYMTSENTARKVKTKNYVAEYAGTSSLFEDQ